jgi:hypothetical protein|tara:strand:+ start:30666 stop:31325 length:660 start_codon:yes stop_codon:yes gene_type:complete
MSDQTFLNKALEAVAEQTNAAARAARAVLQNSPLESIDRQPAIAFCFVETRNLLNDTRKETKANGDDYNGVKPESLLNLCQAVMQKACWNARKQLIAQRMSEEDDRKNGIDYSQDTAEITGVYVDTKNIPDIITEDYSTMLTTYGYLAEKMAYLDDVEPTIAMITIGGKNEDGEWVNESECYNWEDALEAMNAKSQQLSGYQDQTVDDQFEDLANRLSA